MNTDSINITSPHGRERFFTTRWSVVLEAEISNSPDSQAALSWLCNTYWHPIYAFIRRQGHSSADSADLTQEFFRRFLEKDYLANVNKKRGRFRSFLLAAVKHFLFNEYDKATAVKRGGDRAILSFDQIEAEKRYQLEPEDNMSPDRIYNRRWALTLLAQVLENLKKEYTTADGSRAYDLLKDRLINTDNAEPYSELAAKLDMTPGAVKVLVHRMRRRYRDLLKKSIAETVSAPNEVDDEIREIIKILSS